MLKRFWRKRGKDTMNQTEGVPELPAVLTAAEVAAYLRLDPRTVETNLLRPGLLRARKIGARWRITREAMMEYLKHTEGGSV